MVQKCYACGSPRISNIKLHGFASEINLLRKWTSPLNKSVPIVITQHTRLCSQHFTDDDYCQSLSGKPMLKSNAVPSRLFNSRKSFISEFKVVGNHPNVELSDPVTEEASISTNLNNANNSGRNMNNDTIIIKEEVILFDNDSDNLSSLDFKNTNMPQNENVDINKIDVPDNKRKLFRYIEDFHEEDLETPKMRKMFWTTYQRMIINKNYKIKNLRKPNRKLKIKINSLNNLINDLIKEKK